MAARAAEGIRKGERVPGATNAMIWGLIAARLGHNAKRRLADVLPTELRRDFVRAMLADVLRAFTEARGLAGVAVLAGDAEAEAVAREFGAMVIRDDESGSGLNAAVARGTRALRVEGAGGVVIAMGDLPCLDAADVERLIDALPAEGVAAAPSRDGTGTNLLGMRPARALATRFGLGSLEAHRQAAHGAGLAWREVMLDSAALDVDTPADLDALLAGAQTAPRPGEALLLLLHRLAAAGEVAGTPLGDDELRVAAGADVDLAELSRHARTSLGLKK